MPMATDAQLEKNLRLYPWYNVALESLFWAPVFILLFSSKLSASDVLLLESLYYVAVVLLEIPTGFISDKIGRRFSLLVAAAFIGVSNLLFFVGQDFAVFLAAKVLMAFGFTCKSGTDASFHYDTHQALGRTDGFGDAEAKVSSWTFRGSAAAALLGGLVGMTSLAIPFAITSATAFAAFGLMAMCVEPTRFGERSEVPLGTQFFQVLGELKDRDLRWLLGVAVMSVVLVHVPYEVYQPYITLLFEGSIGFAGESPMLAGIHAFVVMLFGSWAAGHSMAIRRKLGMVRTFLVSTLLQNLVILVSALFLHPVGLVVLALRNGPKGMYTAPLSAEVNKRIPTSHRATYLSLQSLAGRLAFGTLLFMISTVVGEGRVDWSAVSKVSEFSFYAGMAGWIMLLLTAKFVRDKS